MPFKIPKTPDISTESPEALFRDLRARNIPGLLSHQADILREYVDGFLDYPDVAFELPTGSGKTLVGLLLCEWRRRKYKEKAVYLCTTNQLVNQVVAQATEKYGIKTNGFTGRKSDYDQNAKSEYLNSETIAVTSYSALFNINPFFDSADIIVLDDVHSAENYIAGNWSLRVERFNPDHNVLFDTLTGILRRVLSPQDFTKMTAANTEGYWDNTWVNKIPTNDFFQLIPEITNVIDAHVKELDLSYRWSQIRDNLAACHVYVGTSEILLRPLFSPTNTHQPFFAAKQRVYMSATLGEGGELERVIGRKDIKRIKIKENWDKQGIGRRLFIFPVRTLTEDESTDLVLDMINFGSRSLIIVPSNQKAQYIHELIHDRLGFRTFTAQEIEASKIPFVTEEKAVAIVANRYDGIDLIDDECRLLVVAGLSRATNLHEQFLISQFGAVALLNDRILTRIQQAFGRCTRSATDYAAIIIWDEDLHSYLLTRDRRKYLHPELRAEINFGIDQSKDIDYGDFLEYLRIFIEHGAEWEKVDNYIASQREQIEKQPLPGAEDLMRSVNSEIDYLYAIWNGDYIGAVECCRQVIGNLTHPELRGYRALWYYLAGSAQWLSVKHNYTKNESLIKEYYSEAQKAAPQIRWLVKLAKTKGERSKMVRADNSLPLIERLERIIEQLGYLHDQKYDAEEKFILESINKNASANFEEGHKRLGLMLGFDAGNVETAGAPDPWWIVDEYLCIIFEDHSDADTESELSITKARQVSSHPKWARANLDLEKEASILPVLVTPVKKFGDEVLPHLDGVYIWPLSDFRSWAKDSLSIIRELRSTFPGVGDLMWRAEAIEAYKNNNMSPEGIIEILENLAKAAVK